MAFGSLDYWTVWETLAEDGIKLTLRECKALVREYYERSSEFTNEPWFQEAYCNEKAFNERAYIEEVQKLAWQDLQNEGKPFLTRISRVAERADDLENNFEYQVLKQRVLSDYPSYDVKLGVVFWEEDYQDFIETCASMEIKTVFDMLLGDLNELRGVGGYNKTHIEKVRQRIASWCEKLCQTKEKVDSETDDSLMADLRGLFFEEEDETQIEFSASI